MRNNAAQVDHDWQPPANAGEGNPYMQVNARLRAPSVEKTAKIIEKPVELDVLGIKMNWTPDGRAFPPAVLDAIKHLFAFAGLGDDWDSYGGKPLSRDVVQPALQLIFAGHSRGHCPRLTPLPNGGVGLRWSVGQIAAEVDISPTAMEATFENLATGDFDEAPPEATVAEIQAMLEARI